MYFIYEKNKKQMNKFLGYKNLFICLYIYAIFFIVTIKFMILINIDME